MKRIAIISLVLLFVVFMGWRILSGNGNGAEELYEFTTIERGDLENVISGTGTLSPVGTVEVGTQVSGTIEEIFVDFNDDVKQGQVLARLDTTMLAAAVDDARAGVLKAEAQCDQAVSDYQRDRELFEKKFVTEVQNQTSKTNMEIAKAALLSAQAGLKRAYANFRYAVITSPIDGKVIQRNVEPGQTVAASFSTPTLFLITEDLSKMEILGLVDESDIGQIVEGMTVRFTVEAHWDKTFHGTVRQIRLQPETIQNVVNYTVVIDAPNEDGLLYPGMTATIDFISERVEDTLLVLNKALRVQPTDEMRKQMRASMEKRLSELPDSMREKIRQRRDGSGGSFRGPRSFAAMMGGGEESDIGQLRVMDEAGNLSTAMVRKGVTDGVKTAITQFERPTREDRSPTGEQGASFPAPPRLQIEEGMRVISGVKQEDDDQRRQSSGALFGRGMGRH